MLRLLFPVSMAMLAVVLIQRGESACKKCAKGTDDASCIMNFTSTFAEDDKLCAKVKNSSTDGDLCKAFPPGYRLVCDKNITCDGTCSAAMATGINMLTPVVLVAIVLLYLSR
ncbi:uncharacterized protein LOC124150318 [Haliotis rufescens]|uniref:uncharacterized protein LOC124150318 n=1 Tax=Haliotis rufescens TaxID=6454 RepID=UPI001EAFAF32|nr:uncharacterized protein LOC124150318 [Haliotis rufescens]